MRVKLCRILIVFLYAAVYVACSVKEERGVCPASLYLEFEQSYPTCPYPANLTVLSLGDVIWTDELDLGKEVGEYCITVPKQPVHVRVWTGTENLETKDGIEIPWGRDCPKVYMCDSDVEIRGEEVRVDVSMRKNHCIMTVVSTDKSGFPYGIHVTGNVCGYTATGQPKSGEFHAPLLKNDDDYVWEMSLPRQTDDSLLLHVSDDTGVLTTFALGQYLSSSGYDWSKADLDDVSVTLDYALTQVRVLIDGWESVYTYVMEI